MGLVDTLALAYESGSKSSVIVVRLAQDSLLASMSPGVTQVSLGFEGFTGAGCKRGG